MSNASQPSKSLRGAARQAVIDAVPEAACKSHEQNHHKLHIRRDGSVQWFECNNTTDDVIDGEAESFAAVPNVITTGTGSVRCNCDFCNEVYSAEEEQRAKDDGREYDRANKFDTRAEAITAAGGESDLSDLEQSMLEKFDELPYGYFGDETKKRFLVSDEGAKTIVEAADYDEAMEAAKDWLRDGYYEERVMASAYVTEIDQDGDPVEHDGRHVEVAVGPLSKPPATDCGKKDEDHDWQSPYSVVGGCKENPGVWSEGGTRMKFLEVCASCGLYKETRTTGFQRNPGEMPETVEYHPATDKSRAWMESLWAED